MAVTFRNFSWILLAAWFACLSCPGQGVESGAAMVNRIDKLCAKIDASLHKCIVSERHLHGLGNMSQRCQGWFLDGKLVKIMVATEEAGWTETVFFDRASAAILIQEVSANPREERLAERTVWYMVNGEPQKTPGASNPKTTEESEEDTSRATPYEEFTVEEYWGHRANLLRETLSQAPKGGRVVDDWSFPNPEKLAENVFECVAKKDLQGLLPLFSKESSSFGIAESSDCDYFSVDKVVGFLKGYLGSKPITWVDRDEFMAEASKKRTPLHLVTYGWKDEDGQIMHLAFVIERRTDGRWELNGISARYPFEERKQWAAERKLWPLATVKTSSGLVLRSLPAVDGGETDRIQIGAEVRIKEAVTENVVVNGVKARWYYVYSEDRADVCGFCFGGDLEIKGNPQIKIDLFQFPQE